MNRFFPILAAALALCAAPAVAQSTYPTASGGRVAGVVELVCDTNGANCAYPTVAAPGGPEAVVGNVAHDAVDTGFPVKMGCYGSGSVPVAVSASGDRTNVWCFTTGQLASTVVSTGGAPVDVGGSGNNEAAPTALAVRAYNRRFNGTGWDNQNKPNLISRLLSAAATTNSTLVKASAGDLFQIRFQTIKAAPVFLKLYNKASAPTCGTDTPVATYYAPASTSFELRFDDPLYFSLGIGYCLTGAAADADTTALVAGDVVTLNAAYQ